jgi:tetratricopeptide (TPR) repeat protein
VSVRTSRSIAVSSLGLLMTAGGAWAVEPPATAASPAAAPAALPAPAAPPVDERIAAYQEFQRAFGARDYAAARPAAERVVVLTEQLHGTDSRELVNPLSNLGAVHYRLGEHPAAEVAFARAVRIVDGQIAGADRSLIAPLRGLGETYLATKQYAEAALALKRATDLSRNLDGLFNVDQLETLDSLIEAYIGLERLQDAEKESQYAFRVAESAYGRTDLRLLDPLDRLARWYEYVGRYTTARGLHARALQLSETQASPGSVLGVDALRGLARTYYLEFIYGPEDPESATADPMAPIAPTPEGRLNPDGERALKLALEALSRAQPPDLQARAGTLVELGDWYLIGGALARAHDAYRQGWAESQSAGGAALVTLQQPRRLAYRPPSISIARASPTRPDEWEERFVEVRFTVGTDGRVSSIETAATNAPAAAERSVQFAVRRARYAPRLENGEPVETTGVLLRERVLVRKGSGSADDGASATETAAAAENAGAGSAQSAESAATPPASP